jgi:hypothetical protein
MARGAVGRGGLLAGLTDDNADLLRQAANETAAELTDRRAYSSTSDHAQTCSGRSLATCSTKIRRYPAFCALTPGGSYGRDP